MDVDKIPCTVSKYGNTSFVSVSLTIIDQLKEKLSGKHSLMLSALGVGMTRATAVINLVDCNIGEIIEVKEGKCFSKLPLPIVKILVFNCIFIMGLFQVGKYY